MIHDYCAFEGGKYHISITGFNNIGIEFYVNHSEKPTMIYDDTGTLVTTRNVKAGEELTTDYGTFSKADSIEFKDF